MSTGTPEQKPKRVYPKRPYTPRKDIALPRIKPGHYEGHGFKLLECMGCWRLSAEAIPPAEVIPPKNFMIRKDAVAFVEKWLDTNKPDWRKIDPAKKRHNPVK